MTYFIGVDLHKTQFTVHNRNEDIYQIYPTTKAGYNLMQADITRKIKAGHQVKVAVESTGNTRFFKNEIEKVGAEVIVINTLKFKVITESAKKTDKHDAMIISEFLSKDMLPESRLCSRESKNIRRLLKSRERFVWAIVVQKNEAHSLLVSLRLEDKRGSFQSKKGRQRILDDLKSKNDYLLEAQSIKLMFDIIDQSQENIKKIEKQLEEITKEDEMVSRLMSILGCGKITS